jgi:hypothetical protein
MGSARRDSTRATHRGRRARKGPFVKPCRRKRVLQGRSQPPERLRRPTLIDLRDALSNVAATIATVQRALTTDEDNEDLAVTLLEAVVYPLNKIIDELDKFCRHGAQAATVSTVVGPARIAELRP